MLAVQREVRLAQPSREQAIETTAIIVQFAQAVRPGIGSAYVRK